VAEDVNWRLVAQRILYAVQFEKVLDDDVVDGIARMILESRTLVDPPAIQLEGIRGALASGVVLSSTQDQGFSEGEFRQFLEKLAEKLEDFRPWPVLPFTAADLSVWDWTDYRVIAQVRAGVNRFPFPFDKVTRDERELYVAVVVLRSGAIVALAKGYFPEEPGLTLLCQGTPTAGVVISEFIAAMKLDRETVTPRGE
jgi:hypothetical protein